GPALGGGDGRVGDRGEGRVGDRRDRRVRRLLVALDLRERPGRVGEHLEETTPVGDELAVYAVLVLEERRVRRGHAVVVRVDRVHPAGLVLLGLVPRVLRRRRDARSVRPRGRPRHLRDPVLRTRALTFIHGKSYAAPF